MRDTEKHEWRGGKKKIEGCSRSVLVCQSVCVTMTGLQQWRAPNSFVHTAAHRGFTLWQTEPRAVLSSAYHSEALQYCREYSSRTPPCFHHLYAHTHTKHFDMMTYIIIIIIIKRKKTGKCMYSFSEMSCLVFYLTVGQTPENSVTGRFLIFETWAYQKWFGIWCQGERRSFKIALQHSFWTSLINWTYKDFLMHYYILFYFAPMTCWNYRTSESYCCIDYDLKIPRFSQL